MEFKPITRQAKSAQRTRPRCVGSSSPQNRHHQAEVRRVLRATGLQAKLTIGQPNDKYEQEADRVADQVMRMSDADVAQRVETGTVQPMRIQRMCPECEEGMAQRQLMQEEEEMLQPKLNGELLQRQPMEEEEEELQAKEMPGQTPNIAPNLESRINSLKGGGQPLDSATRSFFEPRFGHDFSKVRVHTDGSSADTAKSINARAFTLGNHVVMGAGEYQPKSQSGQRLLGHELTHVMQQNPDQRTPSVGEEDFERNPMQRKIIQRQGEEAEHIDPADDSNPSVDLDPPNVSIELPLPMTIRVNGVMFTNPTFLIEGPNGSILDIAPYTGRGVLDFPLAALESLGIPVLSYYHFHYGRARQYLGHNFENAYALSGGTSFIRNALHYGYITADDVTLFGAPSSYNFEHYAGIPHLNIVANPMDIGTMINVSYFNFPLTAGHNNPAVMFSINAPFDQNPFEAFTNLGGAIFHALSGDLYSMPDVTHNYPRFGSEPDAAIGSPTTTTQVSP